MNIIISSKDIKRNVYLGLHNLIPLEFPLLGFLFPSVGPENRPAGTGCWMRRRMMSEAHCEANTMYKLEGANEKHPCGMTNKSAES